MVSIIQEETQKTITQIINLKTKIKVGKLIKKISGGNAIIITMLLIVGIICIINGIINKNDNYVITGIGAILALIIIIILTPSKKKKKKKSTEGGLSF